MAAGFRFAAPTEGRSGWVGSVVRRWISAVILSGLVVMLAACGPEIDEEFPPGDPTLGGALGDNPVLGSGGPGEIPEIDETNYVLWALVAIGLITAGVLLVSVERWERRRAAELASEVGRAD